MQETFLVFMIASGEWGRLLASGGERPGMMFNILHCTGQPQMAKVLRWRNSDLKEHHTVDPSIMLSQINKQESS